LLAMPSGSVPCIVVGKARFHSQPQGIYR
jgi:hypothetical protein